MLAHLVGLYTFADEQGLRPCSDQQTFQPPQGCGRLQTGPVQKGAILLKPAFVISRPYIMRDQKPMCIIFDKDRTTVYNAPITMHDQKLTEDQPEKLENGYIMKDGGRFAFNIENLRKMYGREKPERNKQTDQLFRRSMVGAATRMAIDYAFRWRDNSFDPQEYAHRFRKTFSMPIDHPYLLPPATGQIEYLVPGGKCHHHSDGLRITVIWSDWDRVDGMVPAQLSDIKPPKAGSTYLIDLNKGLQCKHCGEYHGALAFCPKNGEPLMNFGMKPPPPPTWHIT
jgi:hypothetical protein